MTKEEAIKAVRDLKRDHDDILNRFNESKFAGPWEGGCYTSRQKLPSIFIDRDGDYETAVCIQSFNNNDGEFYRISHEGGLVETRVGFVEAKSIADALLVEQGWTLLDELP
jgi:hypothetical protein